MATNTSASSLFNPDVQPTTDPNYLYRLSRPIGDLKNYNAAGAAIEGVGTVAGSVVKVAHELTQENLEDKIHAGVDAIRDPYTKQLGDALTQVQGTKTAQVTTGNATSDATLLSTPAPGATPPSGLQGVDGKLDALESARKNGKISPTDYTARLDAFAKDLRGQYPGWRDYIDSKIQNITGENPANALIRQRTADLNSWIDSKKTETDKIGNLFLSAEFRGEPGVPEQYIMHKEKITSDYQALTFLNKLGADKASLARAKTHLELGDVAIKDRAQTAGQVMAQDANQGVTNIIGTYMTSLGFDKDPAKALQSVADANPERIQELAKNLDVKIQQFYLQKRAEWSTPYKSDPNRSLATDGGLDEMSKKLDAAVAPFKDFAAKLVGKDVTQASYIARQTAAMHDQGEYNMTKDPDMGPQLIDAKTLEKNYGANAMPTIIDSAILNTLPKSYEAYQRRQLTRRAAGTAQPDTGQVATLKDSIEEAQKLVLNDPKVPEGQKKVVTAKLAEGFIQQIEKIADPTTDPALKRRYVEDAFSPQGLGLLRKMEIEGTGPGGKAGAYSVYARLQSEEMTDAVKALGGKHWEMYKNWSTSTIQNELLAPEIKRLNTIQGDPNIKITWDNTNHRWGVNYGKDINVNLKRDYQPDTSMYLSRATGPAVSDFAVKSTSQFVNRLNTAISKYSYIVDKDNGDVNARILGTLQELGFDPTISKPDGMDRKMIDAVEASNKAKQKRQEEIMKKYEKK